MATREITTQEERRLTKQEAVAEWLSTNRRGIALPSGIDLERLRFSTQMALRLNPALERCDLPSLLNAVLYIASAGFYPGPLAHLVPFGNKVVPIIDYKGLIQLIVGAGAKKVEGRVVREQDLFSVTMGTSPSIVHEVRGPSTRAWSHVYAVVWLPNGETQFEVMDKAEVMKIKVRSPSGASGKSSPWATDLEAMAIKTVIRRIAKYVPKWTPELASIMRFEDRMDTTGLLGGWETEAEEIAPVPEVEAPPMDEEELRQGLADLNLAAPGPRQRRPRAAQQQAPVQEVEGPGEAPGPSEGPDWTAFWKQARGFDFEPGPRVWRFLNVTSAEEWFASGKNLDDALAELKALRG